MFGFQSVAGAMLAIGCFPLVGAFAAIGWRWPFALHLVGLLVIPVALTLPRTRSSGTQTERTAPSSRLAGLSLGRSEERRVGKECGSKFRFRWVPTHTKKT